MSDDELIAQIEIQRNLMVSVSTGGSPIKDVNNQYEERRKYIARELERRNIRDPNPYEDLWAWYGYWSSGDLPSYQLRRVYISNLYKPLLQQIRASSLEQGSRVFEEPTGWARVDRSVSEIRIRLAQAETEEQFQGIGLLCREAHISLAQAVYERATHAPVDDIEPSETDAKRMLDSFIAFELSGSANEDARRYVKAAITLANALVHQRNATYRQAALCAEASTSLINIIAIIVGRRDRAN